MFNPYDVVITKHLLQSNLNNRKGIIVGHGQEHPIIGTMYYVQRTDAPHWSEIYPYPVLAIPEIDLKGAQDDKRDL